MTDEEKKAIEYLKEIYNAYESFLEKKMLKNVKIVEELKH